jgi:hypothetical protein
MFSFLLHESYRKMSLSMPGTLIGGVEIQLSFLTLAVDGGE